MTFIHKGHRLLINDLSIQEYGKSVEQMLKEIEDAVAKEEQLLAQQKAKEEQLLAQQKSQRRTTIGSTKSQRRTTIDATKSQRRTTIGTTKSQRRTTIGTTKSQRRTTYRQYAPKFAHQYPNNSHHLQYPPRTCAASINTKRVNLIPYISPNLNNLSTVNHNS
jgi:alpha-L-fucosidase